MYWVCDCTAEGTCECLQEKVVSRVTKTDILSRRARNCEE